MTWSKNIPFRVQFRFLFWESPWGKASEFPNIVIFSSFKLLFSDSQKKGQYKCNSSHSLIISYWPFAKKRIIEGNLHTKSIFFSLIIFLLRFYLAYGNFYKVPSNWNKLKIAPLFFSATLFPWWKFQEHWMYFQFEPGTKNVWKNCFLIKNF